VPPPQAVILAGPNGAGKTTAARVLLAPDTVFINADLIAQRLSGRSDTPGEVEAMRIEIQEIETAVTQQKNFAIETTLAPKALEHRIRDWREAGYTTSLYFMYLSNADVAVHRVRYRTSQGGHDVPESVIRRRYEEGLRNFFVRYRSIVDEWQIFDNTQSPPKSIARASVGEGLRVDDPVLWSTLEERYGR
jgi:predicted ABC-type ATPase